MSLKYLDKKVLEIFLGTQVLAKMLVFVFSWQ